MTQPGQALAQPGKLGFGELAQLGIVEQGGRLAFLGLRGAQFVDAGDHRAQIGEFPGGAVERLAGESPGKRVAQLV